MFKKRRDDSSRATAGRCGLRLALPVLVVAAWLASLSSSPAQDRPGPRLSGPSLRPATRQTARPLPPEIVAMPGVREELEVIHRRSQLVVARGNIVRTAIADPTVIEVVQFSPNEVAIIGLSVGSTTLTVWFENSPDPLIYLVRTIRDPDLDEQRRIDYGKLERKLAVLFPNSQVHLIPISGKVVVKGQARSSEEAALILQIVRGEVINQEGSLGGPQPRAVDPLAGQTAGVFSPFDLASSVIVNMLEVSGEYQVMLKVRIAELSRAQLRRAGIDLDVLINGGRHSLGVVAGGAPAAFTGIFENAEISVLINWLASNGTVKILSEPTLTVLSGHPASFLAGGEFAVPTIIGIDGAQGQGTTFRGFGTSIFVTPVVLDRDLIRMQIVPEYSEVNAGNAVGGIPGVDARRVQTTVELREGQTIAIAGLFAHRADVEVSRIPLLGEIPWIGPRLFTGRRATMDETELLILVTPEIVRPMDADEVPPVPGFYVTPPTDHDLWKRAMTEGAPDTQVYQLAPLGRRNGIGLPVGYRVFEPAPADPLYSPLPTDPYGRAAVPPPGTWPVPPPGSGHHPAAPQFVPQAPHGAWPPASPPHYGPGPSNGPSPWGPSQPHYGPAPPAGAAPHYGPNPVPVEPHYWPAPAPAPSPDGRSLPLSPPGPRSPAAQPPAPPTARWPYGPAVR